jgi:zinc protease
MKKILFFVCLLLTTVVVQAQVDRSKAPLPTAARAIKIGDYQTFTLKNGLQVFVVENHKLPRIQFSLQLKHESIFQGEKEGYVSMAGTLLGTGTTTKTKAQLDEAIDFIGANVSTSANGIFASSLSRHTTKVLDLMTDVLYNPSFPTEELEKLKTQTLSGIQAGKDDPNSIAGNVNNALIYGKQHPYGLFTTEKSLAAITMDDIKGYYNTYFKPNNAYLIIVGDIDLKTAKSLSEKYFGKWVKGDVTASTYTQPTAPAKTYVAFVDRPASVQSVINISYPIAFKPGPPDAIKARLLSQILGGGSSGRLYKNLRETHGYTYGAYAQLASDRLVGNFNASASVRNEVTDSAVFELLAELKKLVTTSVTQEELDMAKAEVAGSFGRSLESPSTIANFALSTVQNNLPKDYYANYLKAVEAVTLADIQAIAKKYITPDNAHIIIVGKAADVADKLKPFGEIKYFDINGEPTTAPAKVVALPAGLTAEKVIANNIAAVGGEKKINELKSVKITSKGTIQGMDLTMVASKKTGGKHLMELSVAGMGVMQKMVSDGKSASMVAQGQKIPLDAALKELSLFEAFIVPETMLAKMNVKTTLKSIENVNGADAYVVDYSFPAGGKMTSYFDVKTGLKVQTTLFVQSPQGEVAVPTQFQDFKEVNGVKLAHTMIQSMGPSKLKFEATSAEANIVLEDAVFKVE